MGKLEGKVAFITGAAWGQGRSHAVRLAKEGADVIAVDLCRQIDTVAYPMATPEDLEQTVKEVEATGRRIVARQADVRDLAALRDAVAAGTAALGPVDIIVANAGIAPQGSPEPDIEAMFRDVIDVNLTGAWNSVMAAVPSMEEKGQGGSIVITGSTLGRRGTGGDRAAAMTAYTASKHGIVGLMRSFANWLAKDNIRVNVVHPTGVATPMVFNEMSLKFLSTIPNAATNLLDVEVVQPIDISNAVAWPACDEARYVTGVELSVDAGFHVK